MLTPITLTGRWAALVPLSISHLVDLYAVSQDEEIWRYMPLPMPQDSDDLEAWLRATLEMQQQGEVLPFAIVDLSSGKAIGSTRYLDISEKDRHVEIGWTWLGRTYWRTPINTECKYLLLRYAFEELACIRVQFKTDLRNTRSQRAIERLGAVREGVHRKAVRVKDYDRWSVYYSILDEEWPVVKPRLEAMLSSDLSK